MSAKLGLKDFFHTIEGNPLGPKLVFLHGLLGFAANWRSISKAFEATHHIFIYDQRGHGRSVKPTSGYLPEDFANDLLLLIDELGWKEINLVGHSMGGRNAINFAARFPERVSRLVIEDIGAESDHNGAEFFEDLFARIPTPFSDKREAKDFLLTKLGNMTLGHFLYTNIEEKSEGVFDWRFSKEAMLKTVREGRIQDRWYDWRNLKMPVLLIRGERSLDLKPEIYKQMLAENKNAKGVEIADSGHWVHFEKPKEFTSALSDFLNHT
ncbi:MAG: alpha/beta hydrolase [Bdellovibrionales bacterium]|nr:alpha/beta hydrolase [Bdellovibrionales bacterium]